MGTIELGTTDRRQLWGRLAIRTLGLGIIVLLSIYALPPLIDMFFPFVMGVIMAWMIHPVIEKIRKKVRISRKLLSMLFTISVALVIGGVIVLILYTLISQIVSLISGWLRSGGSVSDILSTESILTGALNGLPEEMSAWIQNIVAQAAQWLTSSVSALLSSLSKGLGEFFAKVPSFLVGIMVAFSATYFIMADFSSLRIAVLDRYHGGLRNFFGLVRNASATAFGAYLKSQLMLSLGVFAILLVGFLVMGQGYAFLLAFFLGVLDFIPIIGSGTVLVPWAAIALLRGDYALAISLMVIWTLASLFRKIFEPKIVGSQTGLSPLLALFSIFTGMRIAGIMGMILGPIILQIILIVAKSGVFSAFGRDIKLFVDDLGAFMKKQPGAPDDEAHRVE